MSLWNCHDRCSGERFEVHGSDEDTIRQGVEAYIREGIDADTGSVYYNVTATAVDGSEYSFAGTVKPVEDDEETVTCCVCGEDVALDDEGVECIATDHGPDYVCGDCEYTGDNE